VGGLSGVYGLSGITDFTAAAREMRSAPNFGQVNKHSGLFLQGTLSAALRQYGEFLAFEGDAQLLRESESDARAVTGVERVVIARSGQSHFRESLLRRHPRCEMCGIPYRKLLVASHIKPWRVADDYERLDPDNGLTLCAGHDALFDNGFVSFDCDKGGVIAISHAIERGDYGRLVLDPLLTLGMRGKRANSMDFHFTNCFSANPDPA
jgi:hypothetical protein